MIAKEDLEATLEKILKTLIELNDRIDSLEQDRAVERDTRKNTRMMKLKR